jgi:putative FmdB family regulatory protein
MPIYEYKCPNGHLFELFQRMSDEPATVCEVCGEGPVERVLHPVAVHYKGSGFYSTDYGKGGTGKRAAAAKESTDSSSSSSSSDGGSSKDKDTKKPKPAEA